MDSTKKVDAKFNIEKSENLKSKINQYYTQLTRGCGNGSCTNQNCYSSAAFAHPNIDCNKAGALSIKLCKEKAQICSKKVNVLKTKINGLNTLEIDYNDAPSISDLPSLIKHCQDRNNWDPLNKSLYFLFTNKDLLLEHFSIKNPASNNLTSPTNSTTNSLSADVTSDTKGGFSGAKWGVVCENAKEDAVESMEGLETDVQSENHSSNSSVDISNVQVYDVETGSSVDGEYIETASKSQNTECRVDLPRVRTFYQQILAIKEHPFLNTFTGAILVLMRDLLAEANKPTPNYQEWMRNKMADVFIIIMEMPLLDSVEMLDEAMPAFFKLFRYTPVEVQANLVLVWSTFEKEQLQTFVRAVQQFITLQIVLGDWSEDQQVNDGFFITGAVIVLKLLYYASCYGGTLNTHCGQQEKSLQESTASIYKYKKKNLISGANQSDLLQEQLNFQPSQCGVPLVHASEFVNESLSGVLDIHYDLSLFNSVDSTLASSQQHFSFLLHPFVLTTVVKCEAFINDNRRTMLLQRHRDLMDSYFVGNIIVPYLRLHIRRDHIIDDALVNLELIAAESPSDLRKQLFIEFEGEQAVDEGGVSKEFFQILVEQLFNPDFGMFLYDEETHSFWFNANSLETESQFVLIGILLGLAIYNNVILDIRFPLVVYRKLFNLTAVFEDLKLAKPTLYAGLNQLLSHEGDVETDMMLTFSVQVADMFGVTHIHDLKAEGRNMPVTNHNRQEYVDLYSDYLMNKSIEHQFAAFKKGFDMVTLDSPLTQLFTPEELEMLVCGSENLNFNELEESTDYDGGFTKDSSTIKNFWKTTHDLCDKQKRRLLQFVTGSDRVPIGGLAKLKLVITKSGPDSNRLPSSHTCFNVLMLPDYSTKEKLKERLLKAIDYSKGFGML